MKARALSERARMRAAAYDQRRPVDHVRLELPTPTSVNDLHQPKQGGGITLSKAYRTWLKEAGWAINRQRPGRIAGRYQLVLSLPAESGLDLDNGIKAVSDILQDHGIIRNDCNASRIVLEWQDACAATIVEIVPLAPPTSRMGREAVA